MYDLVCLSHLRWSFVHQRPQHLLSRCGHRRRVLFFEEPVFDGDSTRLVCEEGAWGVEVLTPHVGSGVAWDKVDETLAHLLHTAVRERGLARYVTWFDTPMALPVARKLEPLITVYDCMDDLSALRNAPPELVSREAELFELSDVVFTGGYSLYEAKRREHPNVHAFPSSVDFDHFVRARRPGPVPSDQANLPGPQLGFSGVIDERMDLALLDAVAAARPHYQFILLGPVMRIDPAELPRRPNLHYLGQKTYEELPTYIRSWDVALTPFARNEATRCISPTMTPEYLAAGKPVVSTSVRDVVRTYGKAGLALIADTPEDFAAACDRALAQKGSTERIRKADAFLASTSWDETWRAMERLMEAAIEAKDAANSTRFRLAASGGFRKAAGAE
jgi:glycosyltransferase involved in cell wall biosynthesis